MRRHASLYEANMLKNIFLTCSFAALCSAAFAQDNNQNSGQMPMMMSQSDADIVREMATINLSEIELGKLAMQNGSAGFGRDYGSLMVDDHTKAQDELASLASRTDTWLPVGMDVKHRAMHAHLCRMSGEAFDRSYARDMSNGHEEVYWKMMKWRDQVSDPAIKSYIDKYAPIVMSHQITAREAWNMRFWWWDKEYNM